MLEKQDENPRDIFDRYFKKYCDYGTILNHTRDIISDINYFGDTHQFADGILYFHKKKYTITEFMIHRNLLVGEKQYEYIAKVVYK